MKINIGEYYELQAKDMDVIAAAHYRGFVKEWPLILKAVQPMVTETYIDSTMTRRTFSESAFEIIELTKPKKQNSTYKVFKGYDLIDTTPAVTVISIPEKHVHKLVGPIDKQVIEARRAMNILDY